MYETFVKQFIDILDERAPVTLVRNRFEYPLGSVSGEQSTWIHTRLDLVDEDNPYADITISPRDYEIDLYYTVNIPASDQLTDDTLVSRIREIGQVSSISIVQPLDDQHTNTYIVTGHMKINTKNHDQNSNSGTHDISEKIVYLMRSAGYESAFGDDKEDSSRIRSTDEDDDDFVTWDVF